MNAVYSDFINKFTRAIDFVPSNGKVRVKANSEPWFGSKIISATQKKRSTIFKIQKVWLENRKNKAKTSKIFLQKMLHLKKKIITQLLLLLFKITISEYKTQKIITSYGKLCILLV